jgi:hypothetical protein
MTKVAEHLPSKCKSLNSVPSTEERKKERRKEGRKERKKVL